MDLSELLEGLGRCVAYPPKLARILGVKECVLVTQLLYWHGKQADAEGWIYKTQLEIEDETGLSECEQLTTRKRLKALQILEEKLSRLDHKMFYRVNRAALNKVWSDSRISGSTIRGAANQRFGNLRISDSSIQESTSEITSESTLRVGELTLKTETKKQCPLNIPEDLCTPEVAEMWEEWKAYRKSKKKPVSEAAAAQNFRCLREWGPERFVTAIRHSIANDWQGIFEPKAPVSKPAYWQQQQTPDYSQGF